MTEALSRPEKVSICMLVELVGLYKLGSVEGLFFSQVKLTEKMYAAHHELESEGFEPTKAESAAFMKFLINHPDEVMEAIRGTEDH